MSAAPPLQALLCRPKKKKQIAAGGWHRSAAARLALRMVLRRKTVLLTVPWAGVGCVLCRGGCRLWFLPRRRAQRCRFGRLGKRRRHRHCGCDWCSIPRHDKRLLCCRCCPPAPLDAFQSMTRKKRQHAGDGEAHRLMRGEALLRRGRPTRRDAGEDDASGRRENANTNHHTAHCMAPRAWGCRRGCCRKGRQQRTKKRKRTQRPLAARTCAERHCCRAREGAIRAA